MKATHCIKILSLSMLKQMNDDELSVTDAATNHTDNAQLHSDAVGQRSTPVLAANDSAMDVTDETVQAISILTKPRLPVV